MGAVWDPIMCLCSWGISMNKFSISTRERENQPCTKDIWTTSLVPPRTSGSREETEDFATFVNGFHLGHFGCAAAFPRPLFEANI